MKKILFVITQSEYGGAQRFLLNFAKHLDREKFYLQAAIGKDGGFEILKELEDLNMPVVKLEHARRNISPINDFLAIREIRNLVKTFRPDILFLNSSKTSVWGPIAVDCPTTINPRPKIVYRIGGWSFNDPQPFYKRWFRIFLERAFASSKDIIIVNNKKDYEQAIKIGIEPSESLKLIHNGIDINKLNFLDRETAKLQLHEKLPGRPAAFLKTKHVVGTIANFYKTKGLTYLLDTIKIFAAGDKAADTSFVIVGDGPERKKLENKIKELKIENKVFLAGKIKNAYKYLGAFDIFTLSSVKEGSPWVILEAMAAKLPIVATSVGAIPEIIENGKNGIIIPPKNTRAMARTFDKILSNDKLRQELGIQGHQTLLHNFEADKMTREIEKLFTPTD